jgi:hypothetical protein
MSDAPKPHLLWAKGGHAEIVSVAAESIVVRSSTSAPPGARLEATLAEGGDRVKLKSYGSHKEADGSFTLKGRLIDATRDLRDKLERLARGDDAALLERPPRP